MSFHKRDGLNDAQRWIIRYAGRHNGYDAFFIQSTNMEFLTLEGETVKLNRPLSEGAYWHIRSGSALPTDLIK